MGRMQQLRKARTIGQADLARIVGISQSAISDYENGKLLPPFDIQARLAAILGTTTAELFPPQERSNAPST